MLAHLIEVQERIFQSPANCSHSTQGRTLELFALEERLSVFEKSNIIPRYNFDEMFCSGQLTECDAEMVGVVEGI